MEHNDTLPRPAKFRSAGFYPEGRPEIVGLCGVGECKAPHVATVRVDGLNTPVCESHRALASALPAWRVTS